MNTGESVRSFQLLKLKREVAHTKVQRPLWHSLSGQKPFHSRQCFAVWFQRTNARTWPWFDNRLRWPISRQAIDVLEKREHYPFVFPAERKQDQSLYFTLEYLLDISSSFFEDVCRLLLALACFFPQPFLLQSAAVPPWFLLVGRSYRARWTWINLI